MVSISVVVPVYNSGNTLVELVTRLENTGVALTEHFEIILVNDGSFDKSWQQIQSICAEHDNVCGIDLMRNYGQHNALLVGIRRAQYEVIVTIDDDLQHPPEEIPLLVDRLTEGYDVVYGIPNRESHGFWRDMASQITKLALRRALRAETVREISAFRAFRTQLRGAFAAYQSSFVSVDVLLTWGTTRFASVPVRREPRQVGVSNYTFRMLVTHALNMMTGFSTLPLETASAIGFAISLIGLAMLLVVTISYLMGKSKMPEFWLLTAIIVLLAGVQLFVLGFLGVYLARMHFRIMARPVYTVRSETNPREERSETT